MTPRVAVFDILGTVLDERGSFRAAAASALATEDAEAFADEWLQNVSDEIASIARGATSWKPWDQVITDALNQMHPQKARPGVLESVGHHLTPWPDSQSGLAAIRSQCEVVALSNAGLIPLMDCFRGGGLTWDGVLSAEMVQSAKPDPRVYRFLLDTLGIDPGDVVMVAAHAWDLRAAARHGMRTAFVRRPEEDQPDPGDQFDWYADDLIDLAGQLRR